MRKTSFKTKIECLPEQTELYLLTITIKGQDMTIKVDKENLRHHIQIIDNAII